MNVFKKKVKAKDDAYIIPPAIPPDPTLPSKMSRSLKRKPKNVVEPKPEIDLSTALPDTNDFRTSLLMPGLSARFSMLREQDDPNTKVGKASDDSVLFPKRASRLNLFTHNPLSDIAEVESIQTSFRVPFADNDRSYSFSEGGGYASDDAGSVMSRSKPTEGNILFGGRQKMYRIPAPGSSRDLTEGQAPLTAGKHMYQNDVALSPYQQMRLKAREEQEREESQERPTSTGTDEHEHSVVNTPSTGFSKSRGTTSSTASGPSNRRTSTAATSVMSDSPIPRQSNVSASSHKMNPSEYGSEENLLKRNFSSESRKATFHGTEQQGQPPLPTSSVASRQLPQSRSVTNLAEKYTRGASSFSTNTPRATSPPPTMQTHALAPLDFGLKNSSSHSRRYQTASPTTDEEDDNVYNQSLEPNDRGKATAMGLFNRPRQQFDEQKFQERQLQMHEGRISPSSTHGPEYGRITEQQREPGRVALPSIPPSPLNKGFSRGPESNNPSTANRSRAQSNASSTNAAQVQVQVEALIKRQNEEYSSLRAKKPVSTESNARSRQPSKTLMDQPAASRGTFLDTFDGSDEDEAEGDSPMLGRYEPAPRLAPLDIHPALRDDSQTFDFGDHVATNVKVARPQSNASADSSSPSVVHDTPDTSDSLHRSSRTKSTDSPTLGPTTGLGLSGLIRTHLRHDSDKSSLIPPSPRRHSMQQGTFPGSFREREPSVASTAQTINPPESTHSDPWEFDNPHRRQRTPLEPVSKEPMPSMSSKAQQILGQAMSHRNQHASKAQQILGHDAPRQSDEHPAARPWQNDMMPSHHRGESTETHKEFGNELAERARRIQEGLKGVAEAEKRSESPGPRPDRSNPATQAFHALRHKSSKTSLGPRGNESQPKAMKMLGIGGGPKPGMAGRSPNMGARGDYEFDQGLDEYDGRPTPRQRPAEFEPPNGRRTPGFARPPPHPNSSPEDLERSRQRSATPTSGRGPRRDRADSDAGDRSRSRTGRYRDEQPYSPAEYGRQGPSQTPPHWEQPRHYGPPQNPPPHYDPPRGPPPVEGRNYERSASAMSNRPPGITAPRPGPGYFDNRAPTPTMGGTPQLAGSPVPGISAPRPSPRPPFSHSPRSPFQPHPGMSPAVSGPLSTVPSALPSPVAPPPTQSSATGRSTPVEGRSTPAAHRKKSVTKGMISEPTFISSTSSVPLVGLPGGPRPSQIASPPVPAMNPRRRGNTMFERPDGYPSPRTTGSPMFSMPESPRYPGMAMAAAQHAYVDHQQQQRPPPRSRNRLRKISSEGGSMAARARNQAMTTEFEQEKLRSPAMPIFPNRSATSLSIHQDGGMF
ncbi:uncharacterized protein Z518_08348 [Rhinocladiella mackenziei CBS 650.93]|uniref:Uncharacterized protein n=1 Tax=Rhinocladiella mackenziei CBS 650.93 TaxID=1442369 RepID=A0A0D2FKC0_9EURO|nr:uncharacterized protein Z518_08348 [Rhinocladiella mackenziei CBS 650.93]KIX02407.1 hypothetical protein Z518_08348 [Rhinocladiella mackenziei CBS 650.93]